LAKEQNSKPSVTKDVEFKISLSTEDIDKIDEKIRNIEDDSEKSLEESAVTETGEKDN